MSIAEWVFLVSALLTFVLAAVYARWMGHGIKRRERKTQCEYERWKAEMRAKHGKDWPTV